MLAALRRFGTLCLAGALLTGCTAQSNARSPFLMADAKPERGVAAAHTMPVQGIDVSAWQGDIDWVHARAAGTQFAYIKATEGGDFVDPKFLQNWNGAKLAGVARGAYHFLYWCRPVHEQALWFMLNVPADPDALPPVLDLEWNHHSRTCPRTVARDVALENIKTMLAAMEAHTGKRPIIYTDPVFYRQVLEGELPDYQFWLRSVAAEPDDLYAARPWLFWQFTTTGTVPGVPGKVDRDVFNGEQADWDRKVNLLQVRQ